MGYGVSACATCDGAFFREKKVVVAGGGDTALEEALFLTRFASSVTIVHRRDELRASQILQDRAFKNPKIEVVWNKVVDHIEGNERGVTTLHLSDTVSEEASTLDVGGVFIFIGFTPNSGIIKGHFEHDASGYIVTPTHSPA